MNKQELAAKIESLTVFASGLSRINDLRTYSRMGRDVGIVCDCSQAVLREIAAHNRKGQRAFIDNNAFGLFKKAQRSGGSPQANDFTKVFSVYTSLLRSVKDKSLISLVMPDVIGDQAASLNLLQKHRSQIRRFIDAGADVLVPLQAGQLSLPELYRRVVNLLGSNRWAAALPCHVRRITRRSIFDFVYWARPGRLHLLGVAETGRLRSLGKLIWEAHPDVTLSADANFLRSVINTPFTRRVRARVKKEIDDMALDLVNYGDSLYGNCDFTDLVGDVYNTPAFLTPAEARRLALHVTCVPQEQEEIVRAALRTDRAPYCAELDLEETGSVPGSFLGQWLDRNLYGDLGYHLVFGFFTEEAKARVPAHIRSEEITRAERERDRRRGLEMDAHAAQAEFEFEAA